LSPPYWPQYNGAAEAGIGSLKAHAHYEAARHARPAEWTCDDLEAARFKANELARPHSEPGFNDPSPEIKWAERAPILPDERWAFYAGVQQTTQTPSAEAVAVARRHTSQPEDRSVFAPGGHQPGPCGLRLSYVQEEAIYSNAASFRRKRKIENLLG
jgi:hypothetical protein